jgi:hypothetical protein
VKPLVYVAGPITTNPWGCVRQATDAFALLRVAGCVPFLPQLSVLHEAIDPQPYEEWLAYDLEVIDHCHALVRLPGESPGADREAAYARHLGIAVFELDDDHLDEQIQAIACWAGEFKIDRALVAYAQGRGTP